MQKISNYRIDNIIRLFWHNNFNYNGDKYFKYFCCSIWSEKHAYKIVVNLLL